MSEEIAVSPRKERLRERYGELLTPADLAKIFKYPSTESLLKARSRGHLPISLFRIPNRRGWFATTCAVADYLDQLETAGQPARTTGTA